MVFYCSSLNGLIEGAKQRAEVRQDFGAYGVFPKTPGRLSGAAGLSEAAVLGWAGLGQGKLGSSRNTGSEALTSRKMESGC